jgi:CMP-N-acetylneuraminic acid synthetase
MNIVVAIPYWEKYKFPDEAISNRDTLKIGGHSLLERTISICNEVKQVNDVIIYSSNEQVLKSLDDKLEFSFQLRDADLDQQSVSIEDIIERFLSVSDADVIVLVHPRCPFIRAKSITECINKVVSEDYDSAFIATRYKKLAWFEGKPLNYSLGKGVDTLNVSQVEPVILESSSVYVFTRKLFEQTHRRIGSNPYMKFVGRFEGFDIESVDDYHIAELIINAGLDV